MKQVLEIIKKSDRDVCLCTLGDENVVFKEREILLNVKDSIYERMFAKKKFPEFRLVVAFNGSAEPVININKSDVDRLLIYVKDGNNFIEVHTDENGYPILQDDRLIITSVKSSPIMSSTPEEALKKIIEFNERNSKNSKNRQ